MAYRECVKKMTALDFLIDSDGHFFVYCRLPELGDLGTALKFEWRSDLLGSC